WQVWDSSSDHGLF
nr:immunoglobulin light chain junction region [Macaca mulatta]